MGITSVLPDIKPPVLAIAAMLVLLMVLVARCVARARADVARAHPDADCRSDYKLGAAITTFVLAVVFTVPAYMGVLDSLASGNMIALLGGLALCACTVWLVITLIRRPGRFFGGRLPMTLLAAIPLALYVAIMTYSQFVFTHAPMWWTIHRTALVVADVLTLVFVPYAIVTLLILGLMALVRRIRHRTTTP